MCLYNSVISLFPPSPFYCMAESDWDREGMSRKDIGEDDEKRMVDYIRSTGKYDLHLKSAGFGTPQKVSGTVVDPEGGNIQFPRISFFSGMEPLPKTEVSFDMWKFEVGCLLQEQIYAPSVLMYAVRKSLRGKAARICLYLGEAASVEEVVSKLEGRFGTVESGESLIQTFYNAQQNADESVAVWGCRLEELLQRAKCKGSLGDRSFQDMLRTKFWTGLHSDALKSATRHKFDTISQYDILLRQVRCVEQELVDCEKIKVKGKRVHQQAHSVVRDGDITVKLQEITQRLKHLEERSNPISSVDTTDPLASILDRLAEIERKVDGVFQTSFTRERGRGFRGYTNGGSRGNPRPGPRGNSHSNFCPRSEDLN